MTKGALERRPRATRRAPEGHEGSSASPWIPERREQVRISRSDELLPRSSPSVSAREIVAEKATDLVARKCISVACECSTPRGEVIGLKWVETMLKAAQAIVNGNAQGSPLR